MIRKCSTLLGIKQRVMSRSTTKKFSANEKEIARLLKENEEWKDQLSISAEEIQFLEKFLEADIFQKNILNMYEKLRLYANELENFKSDNLALNMEVHNNRYDIEGMLECEDIGCEIFYHDEHLKLQQRVIDFLKNFGQFKMEVFSYTGGLLRKTSKEH